MRLSDKKNEKLRAIPSVDKILLSTYLREQQGPWTSEAVREVLAELKKSILDGLEPDLKIDSIAAMAASRLAKQFPQNLRRVINGSGIVIHTNLGRAPLSRDAIDAVVDAAKSYSTLEFDLEKGRRGSRNELVRNLLITLTGAEDALVVNNNAAALLLTLTTLSKRKEVVVSRGELVEIGGSFRIPDVCRAGGAKLHEVGTTNRTRLADYADAISSRTGMLLAVHTSNFKIVGFTESTKLEELVKLGNEHEVPVVDDLGSGALLDIGSISDLPSEPLIRQRVDAGADVITFSGDKLLGGPQAGIAVGKAKWIAKMRKHPMMRALRPDKMTFAALEATLKAYLAPASISLELPIWKMLSADTNTLRTHGNSIIEAIQNNSLFEIGLGESLSYAGGGSLPDEELQSLAIQFKGPQRKLEKLQSVLRGGDPPLIGYIQDGAFNIDLRTVLLEDGAELVSLINLGIQAI